MSEEITNRNSRVKYIWLAFLLYLVLLVMNILLSDSADKATSSMWVCLAAYTLLLSIFLLVKNGFPNKKQIAAALILALLVYVAYCGKGYVFSFSQVTGAVSTFIAACAFFSVSDKYREQSLRLIRNKNGRSILISIAAGLLVGIVWGGINYLLMKGNTKVDYSLNISRLLVALSPAVLEEMAYRALYFTFCLYLLNGTISNKSESFACWIMMILPHVLAHTPKYFMNGGLVYGLFSTLLLCVIFGLPFAILQRKRDVMSAMIAHGTVDAIRFVIFGI